MNRLFYLIARALGMVGPSILNGFGYLPENPNRNRPHKTKSKRNPDRDAKLFRTYNRRYTHVLSVVVTERNLAAIQQRNAQRAL